jgi:adenosine deaminase
VLELCPTSNLNTHAIADWAEMKRVVRKLLGRGIPLTINTDGPYALKTNMRNEVELCIEHGVLTQEEITQSLHLARRATFVPTATT